MYAYRRAARRAAWKDPDDRGAFNPFAGRGPQQHVQRNHDLEESSNARTDAYAEAPETIVETTQAALDAEDEILSGELESGLQAFAPESDHQAVEPESDHQAVEPKPPISPSTVPFSDVQEVPQETPDELPADAEIMPVELPADAEIMPVELPADAKLKLMPDDSTDMKTTVKTLTGKSLEIYVRPVTTIYQLKKLIQGKEGIPPDQQRIIFEGHQLEDEQTMKDVGVIPNSFIYLVLRLRGGGGAEHDQNSDNSSAQELYSPSSDPRHRRRKFIFRRNNTVEEIKPHRPEAPRLTMASQLRLLLFNSWLHLLFLFIPAGFAVNYCHVNSIVVFCVNFIAIIPSATELSLAVDELSLRTGELLEGIISMTFSNAVQLITSIFLLKSRQIEVLKTSLIGTILSNLLLMNGLAFFVGGFRRELQYYNVTVARLLGSLILLAFVSLMIPTASSLLSGTSLADVVRQSRGTAFMLLSSYALWLLFQFKTHRDTFDQAAEKVPLNSYPSGTAFKGIAKVGAATAATIGGVMGGGTFQDDDDEDEEEFPRLSLPVAIGTIIVSTVLIAFNTQFATDSINGLLDQAGLSTTFVGLVILPLLSNDPTLLKTAYLDKMDLSIALTTEKSMQTALMVIPLVIIIAWPMGVNEMTLSFNSFEIVSLFASILIVNYIIQNGTSNWIQGALLVEAYIIISIAAYFVPRS